MATDSFSKKIDDKRRLTIPADLQHEFKSGVIVAQDPNERCLALYSTDEWNKTIEPALKAREDLPIFGDENQEIARLNIKLRMGKLDSALDGKQGRVTLTQELLNYAGITHEVKAVRIFPGKTIFHVYDVNHEL
jgi:division/cell wall cluster transcriptional repressor MraZ